MNQLQDLITKQLRPNDKLPSERTLSEQYHVSRNTVRSALNQLFLQGYIYRSTGKGTFVADHLGNRTDVAGSFSFTKQMGAMNRNPKSQIEGLTQSPASAEVASHLRIEAGAPVFVLDRLRIADQKPMMVERTYLPADALPGLSRKMLEHASLYDTLESQFGVHIATVDEIFFADLMTAEHAKLLNVPVHSACLQIRRTTFTEAGQVIEYTMSAARADQFVYHVHHAGN